MIQKTLRGNVNPQEQQEIDRIGQHRNAKNKGKAIQMPPLHEALVDVHKEYATARQTTKDMVDLYKTATTTTDVLNGQCTTSQAENQWLSEQLQQTKEEWTSTKTTLEHRCSNVEVVFEQ